MAINLLKLNNM